MSKQELIQAILDYIRTWYNANYIGFIDVILNNPGYTFVIGIPSYMTLTTINCDCDNDTDFLNFIYEELRKRNYVRQEVYVVHRKPEPRKEE
jgi:hypothetical protein